MTENKIALKSGYNKYLKVCSDNIVRGISDAVGATEQFEPIFQVNQFTIKTIFKSEILTYLMPDFNDHFFISGWSTCFDGCQ